jgi:hypothetical protein
VTATGRFSGPRLVQPADNAARMASDAAASVNLIIESSCGEQRSRCSNLRSAAVSLTLRARPV